MGYSPADAAGAGHRKPAETDPALLAALAEPATYGGVPVVVHETHASWVFVAGERAYKIKKPVALGFLDYSTLERRREACREEVRVNRDLAPGIYLAVRALRLTSTGLVFAPDEEAGTPAAEYAVEMRRFEEADTLAGLIAAGGLADDHILAVARRLAAFHRDAPRVAGGGCEEVLGRFRRNLDELEHARGVLERPPGALRGFAEMFVGAHRHEIEARARTGMVRDVHGDLRCEHVLAVPEVRVVDRIEFDPALRQIDIACDLAFLTMDLEAKGQRWAAARLLSAYRACGVDPGSPALLDFYAAHRALIRAKVDLVAAAENPGERRGRLLEKASSMWKLAERLCWRARGPLTIVVCGPSASGKSTLAAELSERSGLELLSSDVIRKGAAGLAPTARAPAELYSPAFNERTYRLLARRACQAIERGDGVIVDATCRSRVERAPLFGRLARAGAPRLVVRCKVPLALALERAARRSEDARSASDATAPVVTEQHRLFEAITELPREELIELETRVSLDDQIDLLTRATDSLLCMRAP